MPEKQGQWDPYGKLKEWLHTLATSSNNKSLKEAMDGVVIQLEHNLDTRNQLRLNSLDADPTEEHPTYSYLVQQMVRGVGRMRVVETKSWENLHKCIRAAEKDGTFLVDAVETVANLLEPTVKVPDYYWHYAMTYTKLYMHVGYVLILFDLSGIRNTRKKNQDKPGPGTHFHPNS
jgi:hypothetical protein